MSGRAEPRGSATRGQADAKRADDGLELLLGGAVNTLAILAGAFRTLFLLLVARLLGDAALGTFSLAWATIDLASRVAELGLGVSIVPEVARADAQGGAETRPLLLTAASFGLGSSVALAGTMVVGVRLFGSSLLQSPELAHAVAVMTLALPGVIVYRVSNGVSRGLRIMRHNLYSRGLVESLVTLSAFLIAVALGGRQLVAVWALVAGVTAAGGVAFLLAFRSASGVRRVSAARGRRLLRHSLPVAGYTLVNLLIQRFDVLLLGAFVGRAPGLDLGTYGAYCAAVEVANVMRRVRQAFDPIYTPVVAHRLAGEAIEPVEDVVGQMGRWILALQLPLAGALVIAGGFALALFGPSFVLAAPWLALLVVAHGLGNIFGLGESLLLVRRPEANLLNSCVGAAVQLGLTVVLVPRVGAAGAPVAMIATQSTLGLLRLAELRWLLAFSWPWRSMRRPMVPAVVAMGIGLAVRWSVPGRLGWAAGATALAVVYLAGWRVLGLDERDRLTLSELRSVVTGTVRGP